MDPDTGKLIVRWMARLAVTAYVVRLLWDLARGDLVARSRDEPPQTSGGSLGADEQQRLRKPGFLSERAVFAIWSAGCIIYLLHVGAAFHFVHDWSHADAFQHTARQTAAVTGWVWGGGLWINYAFTLWWPLDVAWSWRRGLEQMPRPYVVAMHVVVGFLMLNATVVFGPEWWQWAGALLIPVIVLTRRRPSRGRADSHTGSP